jgi:hypothetical protein
VASTNTFRYEIATANAGCRMEMEPEVQSARTKSGATSKKIKCVHNRSGKDQKAAQSDPVKRSALCPK